MHRFLKKATFFMQVAFFIACLFLQATACRRVKL